MPPPKKRARRERLPPHDDQVTQSLLLSDHRTAWLVKYASINDDLVELKSCGETFKCSKKVLVRHSEYFETCLSGQFQEANKRLVDFGDDIEPRYLALYVGMAYSHSSIVPHAAPAPVQNPESLRPKTPLRDFVEVYKLCDRFLSPVMLSFVEKCIKTAIGDGHRALFRTPAEHEFQKLLMRDFANGFEVLDMGHKVQERLGEVMVEYFCEGVSYPAWIACMQEVLDKPKFVGAVSRGFAAKLWALQGGKLRRKELKAPV
ncbi:hypothetical protein BGZ63DRAFT_352538 [Mariannaea sp. PMI_226]|nr:hypothetical protein BGZ63DRAFT_352538 [Mariannaea sp. PMI_226]